MGGLATARWRSAGPGHAVTLLERDPLPDRADPEEAFAAERRGAPQVHQTHGFLARFLLVELRDRFPDVLQDAPRPSAASPPSLDRAASATRSPATRTSRC